MLLDTIKRHDTKSVIKLVSVEGLAQSGYKIPSRIHSVPAMAFDNNNVIFGKQVFDYLLLPGRGLLLAQQATTNATENVATSQPVENGDPVAFALASAHSDQFSLIDRDESSGHSDRNYAWTSIFDDASAGTNVSAFQEETRSKKELPDINAIREQRQLELQQQTDINISALPPPTSTRL